MDGQDRPERASAPRLALPEAAVDDLPAPRAPAVGARLQPAAREVDFSVVVGELAEEEPQELSLSARASARLPVGPLGRPLAPLVLVVCALGLVVGMVGVSLRAQTGPGQTLPPPAAEGAPPAQPSAADPLAPARNVPVIVPALVGLTIDRAFARLRERDLDGKVVEFRLSGKPEGTVLAQDPPAGEQVARGSLVSLRASSGPRPTLVPLVEGLSETQARAVLASEGLQASVVVRPTDGRLPGTIVEQEPAAGSEIARGETVTVVVAAPARVAVPDLVGMPAERASSLLRRAGLEAAVVVRPAGTAPAGVVREQAPPAGSKVPKGTTVSLLVTG